VALNRSLGYASFYLRLKAAGELETTEQDWYRITPGQSYSVGPNDCVAFEVEIFSLPPGREDFIGTLSLQAETISPELANLANPNVNVLTLHVVGKAKETVIVAEPIVAEPIEPASRPIPLLAPAKESPEQKRLWIYALSAGAMLFLVMFFLQEHRATVNHAQIIANSNQRMMVVSGAENGTLLSRPRRPLLRWKRKIPYRFFARSHIEEHQAIEVVRYNPAESTNQVAVGLKNGDIVLYDLKNADSKTQPISLGEECNKDKEAAQKTDFPYKGDRVFDLLFYQSNLYSAHGSGRILQWDISQDNKIRLEACLQDAPNKTVTSMAPVTVKGTSFLAIAGQYNHLSLIPLSNTSEKKLIAPSDSESISRYRHITSLASVTKDRALIATGDDQGNVALWNLDQCDDLGDEPPTQKCEPIESWRGHGDKPVRAVALSKNGCYLVSGGDNGQVKLWPLKLNDETNSFGREGAPLPESQEGIVLRRSRKWLSLNPFKPRPIETVDLIMAENERELVIVSGGEDGKVRIQQYLPPNIKDCALDSSD